MCKHKVYSCCCCFFCKVNIYSLAFADGDHGIRLNLTLMQSLVYSFIESFIHSFVIYSKIFSKHNNWNFTEGERERERNKGITKKPSKPLKRKTNKRIARQFEYEKKKIYKFELLSCLQLESKKWDEVKEKSFLIGVCVCVWYVWKI